MKYKKDFNALISELKRTRLKAKRSTKRLYRDKGKKYFEYDDTSRAIEEKNDGIIMMCNRVLNRIDKIFKT